MQLLDGEHEVGLVDQAVAPLWAPARVDLTHREQQFDARVDRQQVPQVSGFPLRRLDRVDHQGDGARLPQVFSGLVDARAP